MLYVDLHVNNKGHLMPGVSILKFLLRGKVAANQIFLNFDRGSMAAWPQKQNIENIIKNIFLI